MRDEWGHWYFRVTKRYSAFPSVDWLDWGISIRVWIAGWCSGLMLQLGPFMVCIHDESLGEP